MIDEIMNLVRYILILFIVSTLQSCASKKDILYFQDGIKSRTASFTYDANLLQPNDILSITVGAKIPETAAPYNIQSFGSNSMSNTETIKLQGYLVSPEGYIVFPILGKVFVGNKTTTTVEQEITSMLETGRHLLNPIVSIRILNAKVTILGEVNKPGTYSYTEQSLSLPQALGYAGDLTINGERKDILLIREAEGKRIFHHFDLTSSEIMIDPLYNIKQNDIIIVNPNNTKIKTSGYIGNISTILTIGSLLLSSIILLTR